MTFLWASLLALLLVVPMLIGVYAWSQRRRHPAAARYSSLALIRDARPGPSRIRRHLPFALFAVAIAMVAVAISRPAVVVSVPANGTTVILAVDVSGSMCSTDIEPTRLEVAMLAASRFVTGQASRTRIGIVAFSGWAAIIQPATRDRDTLVKRINSLRVGRRTAIGSGILASIDAIAEIDPRVERSLMEGRPGTPPEPVVAGDYAPAIIVVLTDGANNAGIEPLAAARQALDRGIRVYTIGYGTDEGGEMNLECRRRFTGGEPGGSFGGGSVGSSGGGSRGSGVRFRRAIDEDTLVQVAELTNGSYFPAGSADELTRVLEELPTTFITDHEVVELSVGFVGLGALLCSIALLLGRAWRPLP